MAEDPRVRAIEDEMRRRGMVVSDESVLAQQGTTLQSFRNFGEALLKGSARGFIDIIGGWGNLYDHLRKKGDPSAFSSAGIMQGIKDLTGVDVNRIPGYRGSYEFSAAGAPAAALTAVGLPGLFSRTARGVAGEFGVAGTTGLLGQAVAPESPLTQLAIGASPYVAKAGYGAAQAAVNAPRGVFPSIGETYELTRVGRLTPGELSQNRAQLATEARVEASPLSGPAPIAFRRGQALDVEGFLENIFRKETGNIIIQPSTPIGVTQAVKSAFDNFGKALSGKLKSDARRDFGAAKQAGGLIDTTPVVDAARRALSGIAPEEPGFAQLKQSIERILSEYEIPATSAQVTPSTVLGPTGQPASVSIAPATPASNLQIDVKRLQDNLSVWGDAAYSGKADFGKGNIFEGVAPGKAKGIALTILRGFRDSLDQAINNNVPGADKLKQARDNFRDNIQRIEEFANRPLTKYFDVSDVSALVPEDVFAKLKKLPLSQQQVLVDVMQQHPNQVVKDVLDAIRRSQMDDILAKAQRPGAAANEPTVDIKTLAAELKKSPVWESLQANNDAQLALRFMQQVLSKEAAVSPEALSRSGAYGISRGVGGTPIQSAIAREISALVQSTLTNPVALSRLLFEGDNRKMLLDLSRRKVFGQKDYEIASALAKNVGVIAVRGGPALSTTEPISTEAMESMSQQAVPSQIEPEFAREELLREAERRGITE